MGIGLGKRAGERDAPMEGVADGGISHSAGHFPRARSGNTADCDAAMRPADVVEEISERAARGGVQKVWCDLDARLKHEASRGHAGMRHRQVVVVELESVVEQEVEIDRSRAPVDISLPLQCVFDRLEGAKQFPGRQIGFQEAGPIEKGRLIDGASDGLGFVKVARLQDVHSRHESQEFDGTIK